MSVVEAVPQAGIDTIQQTSADSAKDLVNVWHVCDSLQHRECSKQIGQLAIIHVFEPVSLPEELDPKEAFIMKLEVQRGLIQRDESKDTAKVWMPSATSRPFSVTSYMTE